MTNLKPSAMLVGALEAPPAVNLAELAFAAFSAQSEIAIQHEIVRMRNYYHGEQLNFLTPRMRQYLDVTGTGVNFRFNVCHTVIAAMTELMIVEGFESPDAPLVAPAPAPGVPEPAAAETPAAVPGMAGLPTPPPPAEDL